VGGQTTDDPMHFFSLGLQPNRDKLHQMVIDNFYFFRIPLTYKKRCNMNSEKCNSGLRFSVINARLVNKATEAQFNHCFMECEVPYSACLLHSIKTLHELPHPILFTVFLETWGLFHEDSF